MRNGQSQWRPRRATGAIDPTWFKTSRITQVMGVWGKYPMRPDKHASRCSMCSSAVLCISSPVSVPKWYALSIIWSQSLGVSQLGLSLLASLPPTPTCHPAESTILAEGFLSLEMPPFCLQLSKPCTRGLSQEQSYGVSGEEGVLPFHFPFEALFLPLATGDSQTLALLRHTIHHADLCP